MRTLTKNDLKRLMRGALPRLITSWLITLTVQAVFRAAELGKPAYAESVSLLLTAAGTLAAFLLLSLLSLAESGEKTERLILAAAAIAYAAIVASQARNAYVGLAVCLVLGWILWYAVARKGNERDLSPRAAIPLSVAAAVAFAVFIGGVTVLRYLTFRTPNFDFGLFVNMFHNMRTRFAPLVTSERDRLLTHFAVHVSPVYYLILPFYWLFPSPVTLQVAQAVLLASGAIPVYLLSRRFGYSHKASFLWCFAYSFYPALSGGCLYDIHENCFLAPFLLWLFYFAEKKSTALTFVFAFLTMSVKEDAPVYVIFFGLFLLVSRKNRRNGLLLILSALAVFLTETALLARFGDGVMNYRYNNYFTGNGSMLSVVVNLVKDPSMVFHWIFTEERILFVLLMLVPLLGLPLFCGRKPSRLILIGPFLLVNLMPDYQYQYSLYFQYVFGPLAFLFYAAMMNAAEVKKPAKRAIPLLCAAFSLVLFFSSVADRSSVLTDYTANREKYDRMEEILDRIPRELSVRSSTFLLAHIADRDEIYKLESKNETDCVVIDLRYAGTENAAAHDKAYAADPDFFCFEREEGLIAVYVRRGVLPEPAVPE